MASFRASRSRWLATAAELHGLAGLRSTDVIDLSVPGPIARPARLAHPEVVVHQLVIQPEQLVQVNGITATEPLRTLADVILRVDRFAAVSVLDSALNRRLVTTDDLLSGSVPRSGTTRRGRGAWLSQ